MKLQLKRSNVIEGGDAKKPLESQLEYGELAVNYNDQYPSLFIKDSNDTIRKIGGDLDIYQKIEDLAPPVFVCTAAEIDVQSPPALRSEGALWWNTEEGILYIWYEDANSKQWVISVPQGGAGGDAAATVVDINPPSPAQEGQLWWNSDAVEDGGGRLYVYYNSAWVDTSVPGGKGSYLSEDAATEMFLSKLVDDTAAGEITFEGLTTHEAGVNVSGTKTGTVRAYLSSGIADQNTTDYRAFYSNNDYTGGGSIAFITHFQAQPTCPPASLTIGEQVGFIAGSNLAADTVTKAIGFRSDLTARGADGKQITIFGLDDSAPSFCLVR